MRTPLTERTCTEVTDSKLKEQVMRAYPPEVPKGAPMFARAGITSSPDAFAAAASHVAVFQIRPVPPAP